MKKYKWACIINPIAGNGYGYKHKEKIKMHVRSIDPKAPVLITERPGHATELAADLLNNGYDSILVAGGDGTAHEVGSVLVGKKNAAMGIISAGTGNDYNFMAGFPDRFEEIHWKAIKERKIIPFDVGICNNQFFFNGMGIGFDAFMTAESHRDREKTGKSGKGRYNWIILKTLLGYKERARMKSIDGVEEKRKSFLTTIAIGQRFAGSYLLTPKAIVDDGLLDVCDIDPLTLIKRLIFFMKIPKGNHLGDPTVHYSTCENCIFEFQEEVPAHLDGELIFNKRFEVSLEEKCLNIMVF